MAGKQLEKVLKSIERQLLKLLLSHALGRQTSECEELQYKKNCIRNNHSKFPHSPSPNFECEDILDSKRQLKVQRRKNMIADQLEAISTNLEEIQEILVGDGTALAKREISRVLNDLDDVYNELTSTEYREQQQTLKEQTERMKQRVVAEVIGGLEEREESYYRNYWGDTKFIKLLSNFDGFLFLNTYLAEITKENDYPMTPDQVFNYVWEVIAVDIARKKRGKKNVLDSWTDSSLYTRGMMID